MAQGVVNTGELRCTGVNYGSLQGFLSLDIEN